ncbi:MAG: glycosyltransferase [Prevotella sp.]|nr:glycosyltransferase [Prevotella sp.]
MMKITVITVTYNAEHVFPRTAESVFQQTYPHVEHLIIDGASGDKTLSLAYAYKMRSDQAANGHEVLLTSEPDEGIYDAMNKGMKQATGDYLVFLNAGDCFHDDRVLQLVADKAAADKMPAVIYGDTDVVDDEGHFLFHRRLSPPEKLSWRSFREGMLVCHQAFYVSSRLAKTVSYDLQYRYSADVDWCIRVMKEAEQRSLPLVNAHAVLADYLREGQTTIHHRASLKERFRVMRRHYGLFSTVMMHIWFVFRAVIK